MTPPKVLSASSGLGGSCARWRQRIQEGLFHPFHEYLCLTRPRHPNDTLLLQILLCSRGSRERDHRHLCLLHCALAHSAYEGFPYTLIQPGGEEQQIRTLK